MLLAWAICLNKLFAEVRKGLYRLVNALRLFGEVELDGANDNTEMIGLLTMFYREQASIGLIVRKLRRMRKTKSAKITKQTQD